MARLTTTFALLLASTAQYTAARSPSRAGRACLMEGVSKYIISAPYQHSISVISASWWFRTDYPFLDLFPTLTYRNETKKHILSFASEHVPWIYLLEEDERTVYGNRNTFVPVVGEWNQATFVWDSVDGSISFYKNGESAGTGNTSKGLVLPAGGYFLLGDDMWDQRVFGHMDEVTVWAARLTSDEAKQLANGSTSVRPGDRILHWSCDDDEENSTTDDASGIPAEVSSALQGVFKVPSTCPKVNANHSIIAVRASAGAQTFLNLPSGTQILSLPEYGTLYTESGVRVAIGDAPENLIFEVPQSHTIVEEQNFVTNYSVVILHPNAVPVLVNRTTRVFDFENVLVHSIYFTTDNNPTAQNLEQVDADGDILTVFVISMPTNGSMFQFNESAENYCGQKIEGPQKLTDTGARFVYIPAKSSAGVDVHIGFIATDGLDNSSIVFINVQVLPTRESPVPLSQIAQENKSGSTTITLTADYNYLNQGTFSISAPEHGNLYTSAGSLLSPQTRNVTLYQWVDEVINFSTEWTGFGADQVIGKPSVYPVYGNLPGSWAFSDTTGAVEFVHVRFETAVLIEAVEIFEIYDGDSAISIAQLSEDGTFWEVLWSRPTRIDRAPTTAVLTRPNLTLPSSGRHAVRDIKVEFDYIPGEWPEIDAIRLIGIHQVAVADVPNGSNIIKYKASTVGMNDSFKVSILPNTELLERLDYYYYTAPSSTVLIKGYSGYISSGSLTPAGTASLLLSLLFYVSSLL